MEATSLRNNSQPSFLPNRHNADPQMIHIAWWLGLGCQTSNNLAIREEAIGKHRCLWLIFEEFVIGSRQHFGFYRFLSQREKENTSQVSFLVPLLCILFSFFRRHLFINLKGSVGEKERWHWLVYCFNCQQHPWGARLNSARSPMWVVPDTCAITCSLPKGALAGSWNQKQNEDLI